MLKFIELKTVPILSVLAKYGVSGLRFNGEWGSAPCPLPTHKPNDRDRTFQVNVQDNYWKCWSKSCNQAAGKKGGDVINLVAILENCTEYKAAQKLAEMFHKENKTASQIEKRSGDSPEGKQTQKDSQYDTSSAEGVKYTERVKIWFEAISVVKEGETPESYRKRVLRAITSQLIENYKAGKTGRSL